MNPAKISRYLVLVTMTLLAFVAIVVMQSKFDGADQKAAVGIVQMTASKGGLTIPDVLSQKHPGQQPVWSAGTESACFQHVRVRASVASSPAAAPMAYDFVVDINGPSVHPGNPAGEEVLKALADPNAAPMMSGGVATPGSSAPSGATGGTGSGAPAATGAPGAPAATTTPSATAP